MPEFPISGKLFPISDTNYLPNIIDVPKFLILVFLVYPFPLVTKSFPSFCHSIADSDTELFLFHFFPPKI